MTALCPGGGASGPKPGVDSAIAFGGTAIDAAVTAAGFPELGPIIGVIAAGTAFATDVFCTTDPPADPNLTQQDILNVTAPTDPISYGQSAQRVLSWFLHWYWFQVCECFGAATPTPPNIVLPPGTGTNTQLPSGTAGTICWTASTNVTLPAPNFTTLFVTSAEVAAGLFDPAWIQNAVGAPSWFIHELSSRFPAPVQWRVTASIDALPTNGNAAIVLASNAGNGTASGTQLWNWNSSTTSPLEQSSTQQQATQPLAVHDTIEIQNADHAAHTFQIQMDLWCSSPNQANTPCCPPDPLVQRYLQLILNLVQNLYTAPAGAPLTGWADATVHSNLSGQGTFQLGKNVTGIRANFLSIPADIRVTAGTPTFYWDLGFVTPIADFVPLRSLRTVFQTQAMPLPLQTTGIDYTFPPGVVVTLTELVPA